MKRPPILLIITICVLSLISESHQQEEEFHEELFVKPLPSGHVSTYFQFTTTWPIETNSPDSYLHTNLVARPIAEILLHYSVKELHVSLTHGLWRYESWGYPPVEAPPGAEIWAWFSGRNLTDQMVDSEWANLCGTLSGLLCASLNFIDVTNTQRPEYSLMPQFVSNDADAATFIRYSSLPREIVCTENLTPWKKMLPCDKSEGFPSLLRSGNIHSTNYHSVGIHFRMLCPPKSDVCALEMRQTINLVFDKILLADQFSPDFSLRRMFGQGLNGACPLAKTSKIYVDVTSKEFELVPPPHKVIVSQKGGATTEFAVYDAKMMASKAKMFNIAAVHEEKEANVPIFAGPPIHATRFLLGIGKQNGRIVTKIKNTHWSALNIVIMENIPWFVPIYLHTMTFTTQSGVKIQPKAVKYVPGKLRERPYHLEIALQVPARQSIEMSIDFDYVFLKWLEYPPDANHGFYIPSSIITAQLPVARNYTALPIEARLFSESFNASRPFYLVQMRTESLLITLPTPDFSMPYNVICLTCTVVALAFGPIHNVTTKRLELNKDGKEKGSLLAKIKRKLFGTKDQTVTNESTADSTKTEADE